MADIIKRLYERAKYGLILTAAVLTTSCYGQNKLQISCEALRCDKVIHIIETQEVDGRCRSSGIEEVLLQTERGQEKLELECECPEDCQEIYTTAKKAMETGEQACLYNVTWKIPNIFGGTDMLHYQSFACSEKK